MVVADPNFQEWGIQCIMKSFIVRVAILAFSCIILIYNILPTGDCMWIPVYLQLEMAVLHIVITFVCVLYGL